MASYEHLSDSELREQLLQIGLDLPVSINREFLIRKLKSAQDGSSKNGNRRKTIARSTTLHKEADLGGADSKPVNSRAKTRLSLSDIDMTGSPKRKSTPATKAHTHNNSNTSLNVPRDRLPHTSRSDSFHEEDDSLTEPSHFLPTGTRSTPANQGDVSWSKKSTPRDWSRYTSLFPSPVPASTPDTTTFVAPTTTPSANHNNGSWNNHSPINHRMSKRTFGSDIHTPSTDRLSVSNHSSDRGHFISSILVAVAVLFFAMIAFLYLNLSNNAAHVPGLSESATESPKPIIPKPTSPSADDSAFSSNYPICGFEDIGTPCIPTDQLKTSRILFSTLKDELVQRAKWKPCSYNVEDQVSLNVARTLLLQLSDKKKSEVEDCFTSMVILCIENPNWGLTVARSDGTEILNRSELIEIDFSTTTISAPNISPTFLCSCMGFIRLLLTYVIIAGTVGLVVFLVYTAVLRHQTKKKDEANEIFVFVDNILQMLQEQYEHAKETGVDAFLAVNHIRDSLVPAKERVEKAALWAKVVDHISHNESRVREEIQHISGEEFRVWRWLPNASPVASRSRVSFLTPSTSPSVTPPSTPQGNAFSTSNSARPPMGTPCPAAGSSKWQGQAFELSDGSPNALPVTPTNCLKIRQMFDAGAADDERESRIQRAILEKCPDAAICHIGVEHGSADGCVYVKCATKEDARKAYLALHGWWFDGHLLSVKFLREERYLVRFPGAKNAVVPLNRRN